MTFNLATTDATGSRLSEESPYMLPVRMLTCQIHTSQRVSPPSHFHPLSSENPVTAAAACMNCVDVVL